MEKKEQKGRGRAARGRGRSRGRGRGDEVQQPGPHAQVASASAQSSRAHIRGGDRPGGLQPGIQELSSGMGAISLQPSSGGGNGNGNGGPTITARGTDRGSRRLENLVVVKQTKPSTCTTKQGDEGNRVDLVVNYFNLSCNQDWSLNMYHVYYDPAEDRTGPRKKMMRQCAAKFGDSKFIFDGTCLYTITRFPNENTNFQTKNDNDVITTITLKFVRQIHFLEGCFFQIMNILMRKCQEHLGLKLVGRNFYDDKNEMSEDKYNIVIWPGFQTVIRQYERNIMLNVDISHKFIRKDTVYEVLRRMGNRVNQDSDKLLGTVVMTNYNQKTYKIDDFAFNLSPKSEFKTKDGGVSYIDYYQKKYNIVIRDRNQPLILSNPKKSDIRRGQVDPIYLIPELCVITGLDEAMIRDFRTMRDLAKYLRVGPEQRVTTLRGFNNRLITNEKVKDELRSWGMKIDKDLVTVTGRELKDEKIIMNGREFHYVREKADWSNEMRSLRMNIPENLVNWSFIFPGNMQRDAAELVQQLQFVSRSLGMSIAEPRMVPLDRDNISNYVNELPNCAGQQLVMLLLIRARLDKYSAIKRSLSIELGVPSQCVLDRTLSNKARLRSVATKIAIQLNCKLGGEVWNLDIPLKSCMVVGYDAYHDTLKKGHSYGAVVSSYNTNLTQYYGQVTRHANHEELTANFKVCFEKSLQHFQRVRGIKPTHIFVFRDGVGDGQIDYVKEFEVKEIKSCFSGWERQPKFAYIIVSKKINTRIMGRDQRGFKNPKPGTVVDDVVTLPERYDFFLVSQSVGQGTVSPTSYNVIDDSTGLKPGQMQRLAYKLTHLYYNWQGTVRVPAPCLYAHKLAFITGQSTHAPPHNKLSGKLWYL